MKHCKLPNGEADPEELAFMARGYIRACLDIYGATLQPRVKDYLSKSTRFLNILLIDYDRRKGGR